MKTVRKRPQSLANVWALIILSTHVLLGCSVTRTVEVTRIKILERRIIEQVEVTVEVTRIQRVTATPRPTVKPVSPDGDSPDVLVTPGSSTPTPSATATVTPTTATPTRIQTTKRGEDLLAAVTHDPVALGHRGADVSLPRGVAGEDEGVDVGRAVPDHVARIDHL